MSINKKLFELGNDVVRLHKTVESAFPAEFFCDPLSQQTPLREILVEMLRIIDIIRIEAYSSEGSKKKYQLEVVCDEDRIKRINSFLEEEGVEFDVLDLETGRYGLHELNSESK